MSWSDSFIKNFNTRKAQQTGNVPNNGQVGDVTGPVGYQTPASGTGNSSMSTGAPLQEAGSKLCRGCGYEMASNWQSNQDNKCPNCNFLHKNGDPNTQPLGHMDNSGMDQPAQDGNNGLNPINKTMNDGSTYQARKLPWGRATTSLLV